MQENGLASYNSACCEGNVAVQHNLQHQYFSAEACRLRTMNRHCQSIGKSDADHQLRLSEQGRIIPRPSHNGVTVLGPCFQLSGFDFCDSDTSKAMSQGTSCRGLRSTQASPRARGNRSDINGRFLTTWMLQQR